MIDKFADRCIIRSYSEEMARELTGSIDEFMVMLERAVRETEDSINGVMEIEKDDDRWKGGPRGISPGLIKVRCVMGLSANDQSIKGALQAMETRLYNHHLNTDDSGRGEQLYHKKQNHRRYKK